MWKENKGKLIISSIIILLPMCFGILSWKKLPEQMAIHWGLAGNSDGFGSVAFTVFGLPLILLGVYWLCLILSSLDKSNRNQNKKALGMIFWIIPIISLFCNGIIYATAFGMKFDALRLMPICFGTLFIVIGNYLPKCKQNFTLGIKVKWCLENEENWNATHRFGGKVWFIAGVAFLALTFIPAKVMMLVFFLLLFPVIFAPMVYSYVYYRKQKEQGAYEITTTIPKKLEKSSKIVTVIMLPIILIFILFIMFTGSIKLTYNESSFKVESTFWSPLTVEYDAVDSIEYRENFDKGTKVNGIDSAKLLSGIFQNKEFDNYTLYSYTNCKSVVILKVDGKVLVINGEDTQATKAIYDTLLEKCQGGAQ